MKTTDEIREEIDCIRNMLKFESHTQEFKDLVEAREGGLMWVLDEDY